jgi:hypothetical protein
MTFVCHMLAVELKMLQNSFGATYSATPASHVQTMDFQTVGAAVAPQLPSVDNAMDYSSVVNDVLLNDCTDTVNCDTSVLDVLSVFM